MSKKARAVGIDVGTSGVRAAAVGRGRPVAISESAFKSASDTRVPAAWCSGVENSLNVLCEKRGLDGIEGIAVDGTSGTLVALDAGNAPFGAASLYNDMAYARTSASKVPSAMPLTAASLSRR